MWVIVFGVLFSIFSEPAEQNLLKKTIQINSNISVGFLVFITSNILFLLVCYGFNVYVLNGYFNYAVYLYKFFQQNVDFGGWNPVDQ